MVLCDRWPEWRRGMWCSQVRCAQSSEPRLESEFCKVAVGRNQGQAHGAGAAGNCVSTLVWLRFLFRITAIPFVFFDLGCVVS